MEQEQRLWDLFSRQLSGNLSEQERIELELLKAMFPEAVKQHDMLGTLSFRSHEDQSGNDKEEQLSRVFAKIENENREGTAGPRRRKNWLIWAPLVAFAVAGVWYWAIQHKEDAPREWSTVQTRKGSKSKLTLPDGTEVILNAGSTLSYADDFTSGVREVRLNGEGYFKVAAMADHPFIVYTRAQVVKVLGTEFNIQAYDDEQRTETTLFSGKVEVLVKNENKSYILLPRQKIRVLHAVNRKDTITSFTVGNRANILPALQGQLLPAEVDAKDSSLVAAAWVENKFVFRDEPLEILARRLERWYDVEVEITNEKLKDMRFTGSVENEPIGQILEILQSLKPIRYKMTVNKITIY